MTSEAPFQTDGACLMPTDGKAGPRISLLTTHPWDGSAIRGFSILDSSVKMLSS